MSEDINVSEFPANDARENIREGCNWIEDYFRELNNPTLKDELEGYLEEAELNFCRAEEFLKEIAYPISSIESVEIDPETGEEHSNVVYGENVEGIAALEAFIETGQPLREQKPIENVCKRCIPILLRLVETNLQTQLENEKKHQDYLDSMDCS